MHNERTLTHTQTMFVIITTLLHGKPQYERPQWSAYKAYNFTN